MTRIELRIRHSGRLDPEQLADLVALDAEIHGDCGFRRWEMPMFADHGRNYIFEADGVFAGSAQIIRDWDKSDNAYLAGFGLLPAFQGKGLASSFLSLILGELAEEDITAVELTASPGNTAALKVYENAGFRKTAEHAAKYGPGEDRFIMRIDLAKEDK